MKRVRLVWHTLGWPRDVSPDDVAEVMRLLATAAGSPLILEATGQSDSVTHRFAVPEGRHENIAHQLRAALPGNRVEAMQSRPTVEVDRAIELRLSTRHRPLRTEQTATLSRTVLAALCDLKAGETLSLLWVLGPTLLPLAVPNKVEQITGNSWARDIALSAIGKQITVDADTRNALKAKQSEPGWKAAGRIGVKAATASRQRQLIRQVLAALRSTEAPGENRGDPYEPEIREQIGKEQLILLTGCDSDLQAFKSHRVQINAVELFRKFAGSGSRAQVLPKPFDERVVQVF